MNLVVGRLTCNPAGFGFVVPRAPGGKAGDVYVAAGNMKDALHGDRVVARVERHDAEGRRGPVIRVLERGLKRIVGRYEQAGRIRRPRRPLRPARAARAVHPAGRRRGRASPATWSRGHHTAAHRHPQPFRRVLEVLGRLEDPGVDLKVVMAKYGLPDAFPAEVEAEASLVPTEVEPRGPPRPRRLPPLAHRHRGPGDRARPRRRHQPRPAAERTLAPRRAHRGRGPLRARGSALDQEAYLRGTSVYFPDRVVPMLPHALSSNICSLVEGEDRLTQSVVLELDARGKVKKAEFHDGVIRSAARLTYQQAQAIVDGDAALRGRFAALVPLFEGMDELAKVMRRRRYERGSLDFDLPEPKLVLDASGEITGIVATERLDSMKVIEEFMLAANEAVAERLAGAGIPALFRVHETPDPERVEEFAELVASFGYRVPTDLEKIRPEDFQLVLRQIEGKPEEKLISYLLLRTMKLARYTEENLGHFGLATEMYAHFTSPIRRYPDLVVHRALRALRQGGDHGHVREALPEMGRHLSEMERRADEAERELTEWKKVRFMADKLGEVFKGYVTGVQAFGLFVELEDDLRAGPRPRLVDDRRLLRVQREGPLPQGREHPQGLPAGGQGRGPGGARGPRAAAGGLRAGGRAGAGRGGGPEGAASCRAAWPRAAGPARGQRPTETRTPRGLALPRRDPGGPLRYNGPSCRPVPGSGPARPREGRSAMPGDVRSVALNLTSKELIFLQKVTRQEYHFITDEEQEARLRLRDKLLEGFFDQNENRIVLNLTRDELLFLIKLARENYSFIVRIEKEARLALAAKLHKTAESVFGVSSKEE